MGARGSMPLVDNVILAEDYQIGTAALDSISNRTVCVDLVISWGLRRKDFLMEWRHSLVNWYDDWGIGRGLFDGGIEYCSQEGAVGDKTLGLRPS